jgi:hypothetical protein
MSKWAAITAMTGSLANSCSGTALNFNSRFPLLCWYISLFSLSSSGSLHNHPAPSLLQTMENHDDVRFSISVIDSDGLGWGTPRSPIPNLADNSPFSEFGSDSA